MIIRTWKEFLHGGIPGCSAAAVTIGVFDGVHTGHAELLHAITAYADTHNCCSVVFTFRHTPKLFTRSAQHRNIQTLEQRLEKIGEAGVQAVVLIDFTPKFSKMSGESFWESVMNQLPLAYAAIGDDFRMGRDGGLDAEGIRMFFQQQTPSPDVVIVPAILVQGQRVSSSRLRHTVKAGDLEGFAVLAGREYEIPVQELSRGYHHSHVLLPPAGVYRASILDRNRDVVAKAVAVEIQANGTIRGSSIKPEYTLQLHRKE